MKVLFLFISFFMQNAYEDRFAEAKDAIRHASVAQLGMIIRIDAADVWDENKYIYTKDSLQKLLEEDDYRLPEVEDDDCYLIGFGKGETEAADDNEFFVAVFGEMTNNSKEQYESEPGAGVIVVGTSDARDAILKKEGLSMGSFSCKGFSKALDIKEILGKDAKYLKIAEGEKLEEASFVD